MRLVHVSRARGETDNRSRTRTCFACSRPSALYTHTHTHTQQYLAFEFITTPEHINTWKRTRKKRTGTHTNTHKTPPHILCEINKANLMRMCVCVFCGFGTVVITIIIHWSATKKKFRCLAQDAHGWPRLMRVFMFCILSFLCVLCCGQRPVSGRQWSRLFNYPTPSASGFIGERFGCGSGQASALFIYLWSF